MTTLVSLDHAQSIFCGVSDAITCVLSRLVPSESDIDLNQHDSIEILKNLRDVDASFTSSPIFEQFTNILPRMYSRFQVTTDRMFLFSFVLSASSWNTATESVTALEKSWDISLNNLLHLIYYTSKDDFL